jgi:7-carboxy-7-deazaguanine synthase
MINIDEIYFDIQNQTTFVGFPTIFIQLSGGVPCSRYTTKNPQVSIKTNKSLTIEQILDEVSNYNCYIVNIIGGEPLTHPDVTQMISILLNKNYLVVVETNGSESIKSINSKSVIVMEVKCPDDDSFVKVDINNFQYLRTKDQLKFTISSSRDYHWAKDMLFKNMLFEKCNIIFFPSGL